MRKGLGVVASIMLAALSAARAQSVVYVNIAAPAGGNGQTWATAYNNLRTALTAAAASATVSTPVELWIAQGIYNPAPPGGDRFLSFHIAAYVSLYGGFVGTETSRAQADPSLHTTTLHGDLNGDDASNLRSDNSYHVVDIAWPDLSAVIDGVFIAGGQADGPGPGQDRGGGIIADRVNLNRVILGANNATNFGGAIYAGSGALRSCVISGSTCSSASSRGGGAYFDTSAPGARTFIDCTIEYNTAAAGAGVLVLSTPTALFKRCNFSRNQNSDSGPTALPLGTAVGDGGDMIACRLAGNTGYAVYHGSDRIINCIISGNTGVGIKGNPIVRNSVIAYNTAGQGIVRGGGIDTNNSGTALCYNTIFWGNQANAGSNTLWSAYCSENLFGGFNPRINCTSCTIQNFSSNIIPGTGNFGTDPLFVSPNGADGILGTLDDDYRLQPASTSIDSGDSTQIGTDALDADDDGNTAEQLPIDIVGSPRLFDDLGAPNTGVGFPPVDRGPHERNIASTTWVSSAGGVFNTAANWNSGVPNAGIRSLFDATAGGSNNAFSVTFPSSQQAYSLSLQANQVIFNFRSGTTNGDLTLASPAADQQPALLVSRIDPTGLAPRLTVTNTAGPLARRTLSAADADIALEGGSRGDLYVQSPRAQLSIATSLRVGIGGLGTLAVSQRGLVQTGTLQLGVNSTAFGSATVQGDTSVASTLAYGGPGTSLIVGQSGNGSLIIGSPTDSTMPGVLDSSGNAADSVIIGQGSIGVGSVKISGPLSAWYADQGDFTIGDAGSGTLEILNGAQLVTNTSNTLNVARQASSSAFVHIGSGSSWTETTQGMHVGNSGSATIQIDSGGSLNIPSGVLKVDKGGTMTGTGTIASPTVLSTGTIKPGGASPGILTIQGGYNQISSDPANPDSGKLQLRVGGSTPGVDMDALSVIGNAQMGGGLFINLINNFDPPPNFSPQLVSATTRTRNFDVAFFPGLTNSRFFKLTYPRDGSVYLGIGSLGNGIDFGNSVSSSTSTPSAMALGDINNDGLPDLVLAVPDANPANPGSVVVLLNGGNTGNTWNGFVGQITILTNIGHNPQGIAVGNFDGVDGSGGTHRALDIAVSNKNDNTVTVITNTGGGTLGSFTSWTPIATGPAPIGVATGRVTGGTLDDIAIANSGTGIDQDSVTLLRNLNTGGGSGGYEHDQVPVGPRPVSVAISDLTLHSDGRRDLVTSNGGNGSVSVRVGTGANPSTWTGPNMPTGNNPTRVLAADFNGDHLPEIVTVDQADGTVSVLVNTGNATFAPRVALPVGTNPLSAVALDMDQDGDPDLAVVAAGQVQVLRNDFSGGQIAFAPAAPPPPGPGTPILVDHADVNTDNRDDLVTITTGTRTPGSNWSVNPNRGASVCYANCDGSTVIPILNANDFQCFLNQFASGDPAANCDGSTVIPTLNANDFQCFLNAFASGCL